MDTSFLFVSAGVKQELEEEPSNYDENLFGSTNPILIPTEQGHSLNLSSGVSANLEADCHTVKQEPNININNDQELAFKYAAVSQHLTRAWLDNLIPTTIANVSEECRQHSVVYQQSLSTLQPWALSMFDATGKLPDGILNGNWHALGDYEQCLRIAPLNLNFTGKYCQVFLWPALPESTPGKLFPLWLFGIFGSFGDPLVPAEMESFSINQPSFGVCLPSSCSSEDVSLAFTGMTSNSPSILGPSFGFYAITDESFCTSREKPPLVLSAGMTGMIAVLSIIGVFLILGTGLDLLIRYQIVKKENSILVRILLSFSAIENGKKLLTVRSVDKTLSCLHGIRFISFTWVLLGHTYLLTNAASPIPNLGLMLRQFRDSIAFQAITNSFPAVDTFFFLSGLLLCYLSMKTLKKTNSKWGMTSKINPAMVVLQRYIRLTPVYALLLGFFATLWPLIGDGPNWAIIHFTSEACHDVWWTNLLYISNLNPEWGGCLPQSWYLCTEFQIFIVAVLLIWLIYRHELIGLLTIVFITTASCITAATLMIIWDVPPTELIFGNEDFEGYAMYMEYYYIKPWFRCPSFFIGVLFGWIIYKIKQPNYQKPEWLTDSLSRILSIVGWMMAGVTGGTIIYGMFEYSNGRAELSPGLHFIYGGFHRAFWAICVGWVVFACVTDYGGPVKAFLSWDLFNVLGRLTYCGYLIHGSLILSYLARARSPMYYDNTTITYALIGHTTITLFWSAIATLMFEMPFANLQKLLFQGS